jgi:hypothetical protein
MKTFLIVAFVFALLSMFMTIAAALFATFWSISNIGSFGIAGDYATLGLLAAIAGTITSLVVMIVTAVAILSTSASKTLPTVGLVFFIVTFVIAITVAVLSPLWVTSDVVQYGIVSTMPSAGAILGGSVGVMSLIGMIMLIVAIVVKPSEKGA